MGRLRKLHVIDQFVTDNVHVFSTETGQQVKVCKLERASEDGARIAAALNVTQNIPLKVLQALVIRWEPND